MPDCCDRGSTVGPAPSRLEAPAFDAVLVRERERSGPGTGRLSPREAPGWRFPVLMCAAALALLAIVMALAIVVGREAAGSATLDPPFLSAQPCVVMLALIPRAAGLIATRARRVLRRPGRPRAPLSLGDS